MSFHSSYSFQILKGDHAGDLHVHMYYNEGKSRKLLGKFRIPGLEPLPGNEHTLSNRELQVLQKWLSDQKQVKKLQDCLESTVFSSHELLKDIINNGKVEAHNGRTFITVNIAIDDRL